MSKRSVFVQPGSVLAGPTASLAWNASFAGPAGDSHGFHLTLAKGQLQSL
jgi:hypothetical protein